MSSLELEVIAGAAGTYRVAARSHAGDTEGMPTSFPFDEIALERHRKAVEFALLRSAATVRRLATAEERPVQEFGTRLFDFLFPAELREHLAAARNQAARDGIPMQVRLRIRPSELAILPWEFLYDQSRDEYLALSVPVTRYLEVLEPLRPLVASTPLRVLAMVARPGDLTALDVDHERRRLEEAVADLEKAGQVRLSWVEGQTWQDLQSALDQGGWHIFHFIGHGGFDNETGEGVLALGDESGGVYRLAASDLGMLIGDHRSLRLVVLNSCESGRASAGDVFSSTAAVLMRRGVPAVVAMQYDISDAAAIAFARGLYSAVAARLPVDQAVTRARRAIKLTRRNTLEWATPVLYLRSADAAIFAPGQTPSPTGVPPVRSVSLQRPRPAPMPDTGPTGPTVSVPAQPDATPLARFQHDSPVTMMAFSPDGTRVATACAKTVRLWNWEASPSEVARLHHERNVAQMVLSPDSTRIATHSLPGFRAQQTLLWNVATGEEVARLRHSWASNVHLVFSPDGTALAVADGRAVRLWELVSGTIRSEIRHPAVIRTIAFSSDGTRMVALSKYDGIGTIWNVATGQEVGRIQKQDSLIAVAFSPDGTRLVSSAGDGSTLLWNTTDGSKVPWAGMTRIWDAATRREQPWVERMKRWATAFSPDGALLATAGDDQIVRLWDPASGQLMRPLRHPAQVSKVLFSGDGTRLATAADDGKIRLWDPASGEHVMSLPHDDAYGFGQDGARLVTTGADKTIRLWDTTSGQELSQHRREPSIPVIVSPDRIRVAYVTDTGTVQLLDLASGAVLASMRHDDKVQSVMFSPDGSKLATRSGQTVYLWAT